MRTTLMILAVLALAVGSTADDAHGTAGEIESRIRDLRQEARYAEALEAARELRDLRRSAPDSKAFEVADADRLVATLEHATQMGEGEQRLLARADSLDGFLVECWREGRLADGARAARRQLEIRRELLGAEHPEVALSLCRLAVLLDNQGQASEAETLLREALSMQRKLLGAVHPDVAATINNIAEAVRDQGRLADAEPLYLEALDVRRAALGAEHPLVIRSLNNLASVYAESDRYEAAEPLAREALSLGTRVFGEDHPTVGNSLMILANVLVAQGEYAAAEPLYREVIGIYREHLGEDSNYVAMAIANLAMTLHDQGDYVGAEQLYREALELRRRIFGDEHPEVAKSESNLAEILYARGDYPGAEALFRDALAMSRGALGEEHPLVAEILHNLACAVYAEGDLASAESLYLEALDIDVARLGREHSDVASLLSSLGDLYLARGERARADSVYREALAIRRRLMGEEHPEVVRSLCEVASLARVRGRGAAAESLYAEAARIYDLARTRVGLGLRRASFLEGERPYADLAAVRLDLGEPEAAWMAAEKSLSRSLLDLLMVTEHRELTDAETAREDSLRRLLGDLERELATWVHAAQGDTSTAARRQVTEARDRLLATEVAWGSLEETLRARYPMTEGGVYPLDRVQADLSEGEALLGWLDAEPKGIEPESWGYVIRKSGPVRWVRLPSAPEAGAEPSARARARALRDAMADPDTPALTVTRAAHDLWAERIGPLTGYLDGVRNLVVVPSGAMLGIPIEALIDETGRTVAETYSVSYAPSATIHTWLAETRPHAARGGRRALLVGDPPFTDAQFAAMQGDALPEATVTAMLDSAPDAESLRAVLAGNDAALSTLPRLPGTREEIRTLARVVPNPTVLLGPDASEQELVRLAEGGGMQEFEVLHFATHALIDDERPEQSALVLSQVDLPDPLEAAKAGTRIYDGLATASEITREWRLAADLVTLSACETALGTELLGEGYVGLAHALFQSGARGLLVSLWPVEDESTSLLMRRFYENWFGEYDDERNGWFGEPMSKAEALREAKLWLRGYTDGGGDHPYERPYFWSAFVLFGDPS